MDRVNISRDDALKFIKSSNLDTRRMCTNVLDVFSVGDECQDGYLVSPTRIGEDSMYGQVYQATCGSDEQTSYVAKWLSTESKESQSDAITEVDIQITAAKAGLAPKIHKMWVCDIGTIIVMDNMSMTVGRVLRSLTEEQMISTISYYHPILLDVYEKIYDKSKVSDRMSEKCAKMERLVQNPDLIQNLDDLISMRACLNGFCYGTSTAPIDSIEVQVADSAVQRREKSDLLEDCMSLLSSLHLLNITHNDCHLNNFMIDSDFQTKLIDFGLSIYNDVPDETDELGNAAVANVQKVDFKRVLQNIDRFIQEGYINIKYLKPIVEKYL